MPNFYRIKTCLILIVFNFLFLEPGFSANTKAHKVDELPYGVALYDFYQDKYFTSITDILVAKKMETITDNSKNAELLLGGLYLSYDMRNQADEIFKNITSTTLQDVPIEILDQARFYIGKSHFNSNEKEKAREVFLAIDAKSLDLESESERLNMLSETFIENNQYEDVIKTLSLFPGNSTWKKYTQYNLAISMIKHDRQTEGVSLLNDIAALQSPKKEIDMLQDQASRALAVIYTRAGYLDQAAKYFENMKMGNSQSNSALLGLGWIRFKKFDYQEAISAWMELSRRSKSDPDVQEALILIPYALEKSGDRESALSQYNSAIEAYDQQLKSIKKIEHTITQGKVIDILKSSAYHEGKLSPEEMINLMGPEYSDYLFNLITSSDFKDTVTIYRELIVLQNNLSKWGQSIPSLNLILDEKIKTYHNRLPGVINSLKFEAAKKRQEELDELLEKLDKALKSNSITVLANNEEKKLFSIFKKIQEGLEKISDDSDEITDIKSKYNFLLGVLSWNISTDFSPRLWAIRSSIMGLENELKNVHKKIKSLTRVWDVAPIVHQRFRNKIKGKKERINNLQLSVSKLISDQEKNIQLMAESAIKQHRDYLTKYHDRALFARARVYDSLVRKN